MGFAMATIYRKYRPQRFEQVIGQEAIKISLCQQIKTNQLAHAYLFCGPRGIGKTTIARIFAKSINCTTKNQDQAEPCNECDSCTAVNEARSLSLLEIDAASNRGINEIRELREHVRFLPQNSRYKIFIIDEVHMLTTEAFNALLKTLEEPPNYAIFILATTEVHKLPETVISRCQRFDFKKLPREQMSARLRFIAKEEGVDMSDDILQTIIIRSEGCGRDAESILGQLIGLGKKTLNWDDVALILPRSDFQLINEWLSDITSQNTAQSLAIIDRLIDEGVDVERFALDALAIIREKMIQSASGDDGSQSALFWWRLLDRLAKRIVDIRVMSELPQLPLELFVVEMCNQETNLHHTVAQSVETKEYEIASKQTPQSETKIIQSVSDREAPQLDSALSLEDIKQSWETVLDYIQTNHPSLSFILSAGEPVKFDGKVVTIGFHYPFHQEMIKQQNNRVSLSKAVVSAFGKEIAFDTTSFESQKKTQEEDKIPVSDVVSLALETFGGAVSDV